ncbi:MAG TPA: glycosyltransferase family 2 protein, partial [Pyrinomonadaceae bacterium]|nr:glycosyltransferase family 2 protein [Pyrinomonadaceae bacterium]
MRGRRKISVALCTYDGERFLGEQLESIASQTLPPDELVVRDDGSSDATASIVKEFARESGMRVDFRINSERLGSTRNFERVISECTGDIIFLADQDDIWFEHKVEKLVGYLDTHDEIDLVFSDAELVNEASLPLKKKLWDKTFPERKRHRFSAGSELDQLVWGDVVTGATMAFRSDLRKWLTPTPDIGLLSHDAWIALTAALIGKVGIVHEPLMKYRVHPAQQIGVSTGPIKRRDRRADIPFFEKT